MADELLLSTDGQTFSRDPAGSLFGNVTATPGAIYESALWVRNDGPTAGEYVVEVVDVAGDAACLAGVSIAGSPMSGGSVLAAGQVAPGSATQVNVELAMSDSLLLCRGATTTFSVRTKLSGETPPPPLPGPGPTEEPSADPEPTDEATADPAPTDEPSTYPEPTKDPGPAPSDEPGPLVVGGPAGQWDVDADGVLSAYEHWLAVTGTEHTETAFWQWVSTSSDPGDLDGDGVLSAYEQWLLDSKTVPGPDTYAQWVAANAPLLTPAPKATGETTATTRPADQAAPNYSGGSLATTGGDVGVVLVVAALLTTIGMLARRRARAQNSDVSNAERTSS